MPDLSRPLVVSVVSVLLTAAVTYWLSYSLHKRQKATKTLRCEATYCVGFLAEIIGELGNALETWFGSQVVHQPVIITYPLFPSFGASP